MQTQAPRWFLVLFNCVVWAGLILLAAWVLSWAWALSLTAIFHVVQITYGQAVALICLVTVSGGVIFRLIPALLTLFVSQPTHAPQPVTPAQASHVDTLMQQMQQALLSQQTSQQAVSAAAVPKTGDDAVPPTPEKPKLDHLKLKGGPKEWDE